jgi:hypothetical protein
VNSQVVGFRYRHFAGHIHLPAQGLTFDRRFLHANKDWFNISTSEMKVSSRRINLQAIVTL